jgi:RimJ/RimL family protein N-acetyltransferase
MTSPPAVPRLSDGTVTLRRHTEADVPALLEQALDPVSVRWTTVPVPSTEETSRTYALDVIPAGWEHDTEWAFAVEAPDEHGVGRFAGTVSLRNRDAGRAEIAFGAHPWARGRGVMARALELMLAWGFEEKQLSTVIWWANKGNWASRKLAWRLGFAHSGTVRRWLPQRGELLDAWVGELLRDDVRLPRHPWLEVPRIVGEGVVLRAHRPADAQRVLEACSDERTAYWLGQMPQPYTLEMAEEYVDSRKEALATGKGVHWAVADADTDELLANISLFDLKLGREGEIGYWTHPAARGHGVMTQACGLVLRHGFVDEADGGLGLARIMIYAAEGNTASRRVIEANGFTETGRERLGTRLRDGTLVDTITYDMLRAELPPPIRLR